MEERMEARAEERVREQEASRLGAAGTADRTAARAARAKGTATEGERGTRTWSRHGRGKEGLLFLRDEAVQPSRRKPEAFGGPADALADETAFRLRNTLLLPLRSGARLGTGVCRGRPRGPVGRVRGPSPHRPGGAEPGGVRPAHAGRPERRSRPLRPRPRAKVADFLVNAREPGLRWAGPHICGRAPGRSGASRARMPPARKGTSRPSLATRITEKSQ